MFMKSILSTVFSSVEVLGLENIPKHGPIIFTGNHMNQFVDGLVIMSTCPHTVGFLIAEKSFKKPVIGDLAKAAGCIPVIRPQDVASKGIGQVSLCLSCYHILMNCIGVLSAS
jgi:glycerol-3-phosphate O-acyltransferase/dihydroxyacetone phosphate acyltransferase